MNKSPAFQFYPSDFLADEKVLVMTNQEVGCYIKLLCVSWREGSIPDAIPALAALCGESKKAMSRMWPHIAVCFLPALDRTNRLIHPRLERERAAQESYRAERASAGKSGAKSRWNRKTQDGSAIAKPSQSHDSAIAQSSESHSSAIAEPWLSHVDGDGSAMFLPMANDGSSSSSSSAHSCIGADAPMLSDEDPGLWDKPGSLPLHPAEPKQTTPRAPARSKARAESAGAQAWGTYAAAYELRYGVAPVRNARVNAQLGQLVSRLGAEESKHVAAWYVGHNGALYVRTKHPVGLLLRDAEGLHTEWRRQQQVTETDARHIDRRQATANAFTPLLEEAERAAVQKRERGIGG